MIRPATIHDVPRIQEIINGHAELGKMLFKSLAQLYEDLRDFAVYEEQVSEWSSVGVPEAETHATTPALRHSTTSSPRVLGCCALTVIWADLAEVRSLAVDDAFRGRGIGRKLVEWSFDEARRLHIRKLMSLTYEQAFFEKLGFEVVEKDTLPLKVWSDCVRCPKRDGCDEIAMVRVLEDVPVVNAEPAAPTPRGVSVPVLPHFED